MPYVKPRRPPTQADIAKATGFARSTVAAALSGAPSFNLNPDTIKRIREVADQLGYRPNRYARIMLEGRSRTIGLLSLGFGLQITNERMTAAFTISRELGYFPLLVEIRDHQKEAEAVFTQLQDAQIEGLLILGHMKELQRYLERLLKHGVAIAALNSYPSMGIDCFVSDRIQGFYDLTEHLIKLGRKRIEILCNWTGKPNAQHSQHATMAVEGFTKAMRAHKMPLDESNFIPGVVDLSIDEVPYYSMGYRVIRERLKRKPLPDALICSDDSVAIGAINAIYSHGLQVPDDIAVTGFNNEPQSRYCWPPLTTARQPARQQVRQALECIVNRIENPRPITMGKMHLLPCKVQLRESTLGKVAKPVMVS